MDKRWALLLTIQLSFLLIGLPFSTSTLCHENERSALLKFKKKNFQKTTDSCGFGPDDTHWEIESWKLEVANGNCCAWEGIECDPNNGHVIAVELFDNCLSGTVSSNTTIFHLIHLQRLNLSDNYRLIGQVPPEILKLTNLLSLDLSLTSLELKKPNLSDLVQSLTKIEILNLTAVNISTPIPSALANLSSLRSLLLKGSKLQGEFPPNIFNVPKLEFLDLSNNPQLSGHLPEFYWRNPLKSLSIFQTNFSGQLPFSLGNLTSLNELILSRNNFVGTIPSSLGNLTLLKKLSLYGNQLTGTIPYWIGQLSHLEHLDLGYNELKGEIPSSIGQLSNLKELYLSSNMLVGKIPFSFVNLTQLTDLNLKDNQLSGQILADLTKFVHLESVEITFNNFSGQIPRSIEKLKNLVILDLCFNNFNGTAHLSWFLKLKGLSVLGLSFNKLSLVDEVNNTNANIGNLQILALASCSLSSFPSFLRHQDRMTFVELSYNKIHGEIPEWFLNMSTMSLSTLNLASNSLTSNPHQPINFRWKNIRLLDLRDNNLEGSLPIPPASIEYYLVSRNKLSGELPPQICELSNVSGIDVDENNLAGILPQCLKNLSDTLSILSLQSNNFYGEIPSLLTNGDCELRMLDLSGNHFQGPLPRNLAKCFELEFLNLGSNQIKDVFPFWLGSLRKLRVLILHSNEFHGPIGEPKYIDDFASLQIIDISANNFSSCLPSKYFECWKAMKFPTLYEDNYMGRFMGQSGIYAPVVYDYSITVISKGIKMAYPKIQNYLNFVDLSMNNFTCEIPSSIGSLAEVQFLNISNNKLTGTIPSFLKSLKKLEALDLSQNKLHGKIPQELAQLDFLGTFNVSYNNLYGKIPEGRHFDTFSNNSYLGNEKLCGLPLSKKCDNNNETVPQQQSEGKNGESIEIDWRVVLIGYGSGLVIGVIIGQSFTIRPSGWIFKYFNRRARHMR